MRNVRRQQVCENRKKRRWIVLTFSLLMIIYLTFTIILGDKGFLKYIELKSIMNQMMADTLTIKKQNEDVTGHIDSLRQDPDTIEELAREYGLTKEDEIIFKFDDD
jgi:cell division protein FtsB